MREVIRIGGVILSVTSGPFTVFAVLKPKDRETVRAGVSRKEWRGPEIDL